MSFFSCNFAIANYFCIEAKFVWVHIKRLTVLFGGCFSDLADCTSLNNSCIYFVFNSLKRMLLKETVMKTKRRRRMLKQP